ncbi:p53-like transcription factor [Rhizodiscina lignyota]|uniref:P53-like transcription factor n=1 Tax=Rhizodiscina lignyota TaxID=1504668 RepID=A0A9P4IEQ6_9PEZI|nr:p53-like transcription factor [Rhizodiscina lignyota]
MDGNFDILTMSYQAPPLQQPNVAPLDTGLLPLEPLDHTSNFDQETFAGSEDMFSQHGMGGQMPPQLRRFPSTYDDPFSDVLSQYDQHMPPDQNGMEGPSVERGHKLLSFSMPNYSFHILDYAYRRTTLSLTAQLHGMFFLAESPWAGSDAANQPTELTCYRRNLFQISGTLMLPRGLRYIVTEQNEQIPILSQELTISATESVEGNSVKIISVPWKTPAAGAPAVEDKTEKEPPSIPLDLMNGQEVDEAFVTFPISWKRLQFRIATANNGRRKELQQHFIIHLKLMATLANGAKVSVCEVTSGAIIVRGRSPRNFQSRKDIAISQSGGSVRNRNNNHANNNHQAAQPSRNSNAGSAVGSMPKQEPNSAPLEMPPHAFPYDASDIQVSPDFFEWKIPGGANHTGALTALPNDYAVISPQGAGPGGGYAQSSPDLTRVPPPRSTPAAPINLSLTDDEPAKKASASPSDSHKGKKTVQPMPRPPSFSIGLMSSPDESAELLYEYFPLSLNDWMPPVDAVYRPHVVHHMNVPGDIKSDRVKGRSKRYFSEDQPA